MSILETRVRYLEIGIKSGRVKPRKQPKIFNKMVFPILEKEEYFYWAAYSDKFTWFEFKFTQNISDLLVPGEDVMLNDQKVTDDFDTKLIDGLIIVGGQINKFINENKIQKPYVFVSKIDRECLRETYSKMGHIWCNITLPLINIPFGVFMYESTDDSGLKQHYILKQHYAFRVGIHFLPNDYKDKIK